MNEPTRDDVLKELKSIYFDTECVTSKNQNPYTVLVSFRHPFKKTTYNLMDEDKASYIYVTVLDMRLTISKMEHLKDGVTVTEAQVIYYKDCADTKELATKLNKVILVMFGVEEF